VFNLLLSGASLTILDFIRFFIMQLSVAYY
jgi:hypothetical protein